MNPIFIVNKNETIDRPNTPTKAKYTFDNWYTDITKKTLFDFEKFEEKWYQYK